MAQTETLFGLEDFARSYIRGVSDHREVRTEHLAEAFRSYFQLPSFPSLADLTLLCDKLGASLHSLPEWAPMEGANTWAEGRRPEIHLRKNLRRKRSETTVGHEIRELIETAFRRVSPSYVGLDTADNRSMNGESDHFAGCLLMQAEASKELLGRFGFDLIRFSEQTGRSLSSVVVRLQSLYSVASGERRPHAGIWLFEAPWHKANAAFGDPISMTANYEAKLCGFSLSKSKKHGASLARGRLPRKGEDLTYYGLGQMAVIDEAPMMEFITGFDLFKEHDFTVVAEPMFFRGTAHKLLVVASRNDSLPSFQRWIDRLPIRSTFWMSDTPNPV